MQPVIGPQALIPGHLPPTGEGKAPASLTSGDVASGTVALSSPPSPHGPRAPWKVRFPLSPCPGPWEHPVNECHLLGACWGWWQPLGGCRLSPSQRPEGHYFSSCSFVRSSVCLSVHELTDPTEACSVRPRCWPRRPRNVRSVPGAQVLGAGTWPGQWAAGAQGPREPGAGSALAFPSGLGRGLTGRGVVRGAGARSAERHRGSLCCQGSWW